MSRVRPSTGLCFALFTSTFIECGLLSLAACIIVSCRHLFQHRLFNIELLKQNEMHNTVALVRRGLEDGKGRGKGEEESLCVVLVAGALD